jgi:hypothetical protein
MRRLIESVAVGNARIEKSHELSERSIKSDTVSRLLDRRFTSTRDPAHHRLFPLRHDGDDRIP